MNSSIKSRQAKAESLIFNSDGQRPSEQKQKIIEALKGRDQDFALSGLCFLCAHIFIGRCPTLLNLKAFSLNLTAIVIQPTITDK